MSKVRVRFAPSPTGPLHIGGLRTALFNYLFAKQNGGTFVLRIEDTDRNRFVEGAEGYILDALKWCSIMPDEGVGATGDCGPYRQSERKDLYKAYADQLLESGHAYIAFDTAEELDTLRKEAETRKETFTYNCFVRDSLNNSLSLSAEETQTKINNGTPYVVRFKMPKNESVVLEDMIRGDIHIETNTLDDKVLFKSDGMPTYHLANIVDDHLMQITHVIRGEEWLPSLPLHTLLYDAFGWEKPKFAHLPLILKPEGKGKLSKRDGDKHGFPVFPLEWKAPTGETSMGFKEEGYLPEALVNFLALLGWNPGTEEEHFSLQELVNTFSLERVNKSGARFDIAKLKSFNQHYLQKKSSEEILPDFQKELSKSKIQLNDVYDLKIIDLMKERAVFVKDLVTQSLMFYKAPKIYDAKALKKAWKEESPVLIDTFIEELSTLESFDSASIQSAIQAFVAAKEIGFGKLMMPLRLLITGSLQGPDIPKTMEILGKEESLYRLNIRELSSS